MVTAMVRRPGRPKAVETRRRLSVVKQRASGNVARRRSLPEYLEAGEVQTIIGLAPNPAARLLMLTQWRAGLRISEALALEVRDLALESDRPALRVRKGKGSKPRVVPMHPELRAAFVNALAYGKVGQGQIFGVSRSTAWRWVQQAASRATELGKLAPGRTLGTHVLRHSYARHLLLSGIPINYLSRWLGHASITTTLIYLELVPDPAGSLERVP